jgi:histidinol-phosphate/aromatic aminotransferase/cobyric acid decarboxylase-like protein
MDTKFSTQHTMNIQFTDTEKALINKLNALKEESGTHSPSIFTYEQKLPELKIKIDACFLSNPYATDLFVQYFEKEIVEKGLLRNLFEFYPSQNQIIAELLGNFMRVDPAHIFIGNGAIEIIQAVIQRFSAQKILLNIPTFSSYYEFVEERHTVVYNVLKKENNFELNPEAYISLIEKEKPDTIVLINPNNPNGGYFNYDTVKYILKEATRLGVKTIILDESFIHFAYEDQAYKLIDTSKLIHEYDNLVILKSMSKDFGIAGVRAGYAIMSKERVNALLKNGYLWNTNGFAEYFFRLYTRADFAYNYESMRIKYIMETVDFMDALKKIKGLKVYPSYANFAMIELPESISTDDFTSALLIKYGIYVRNCDDKIGLEGNYIRVASRTKEENKLIIEALTELMSGYTK